MKIHVEQHSRESLNTVGGRKMEHAAGRERDIYIYIRTYFVYIHIDLIYSEPSAKFHGLCQFLLFAAPHTAYPGPLKYSAPEI